MGIILTLIFAVIIAGTTNPKVPKMNKLTPEEKHVIVNKGTERPFSGKYNDHFNVGIYTCRQCGAPLYRSDDKFKTSCGWQPIRH